MSITIVSTKVLPERSRNRGRKGGKEVPRVKGYHSETSIRTSGLQFCGLRE